MPDHLEEIRDIVKSGFHVPADVALLLAEVDRLTAETTTAFDRGKHAGRQELARELLTLIGEEI